MPYAIATLALVALLLVTGWLAVRGVERVEGRKKDADPLDEQRRKVDAEVAREEAMRRDGARRLSHVGDTARFGAHLRAHRRENVPALRPVTVHDGRVVPLNNTQEVGNG